MDFSHTHHFDADIDAVAAMLADESFSLTRGRAAGAEECDAIVDGTPDADFTVSIRRVVPASTIPQEFRGLVGRTLNVKYTEAWEAPADGERHGTFAMEIAGTPGHAAGTLQLVATDESTDLSLAGTVHVTVPLFGHVIEQAVAAAVGKAFDLELAAADEWLASR
jgi:hypothetical protein